MLALPISKNSIVFLLKQANSNKPRYQALAIIKYIYLIYNNKLLCLILMT
jgi:hypothetical protein